jgi:hypothetical protein
VAAITGGQNGINWHWAAIPQMNGSPLAGRSSGQGSVAISGTGCSGEPVWSIVPHLSRESAAFAVIKAKLRLVADLALQMPILGPRSSLCPVIRGDADHACVDYTHGRLSRPTPRTEGAVLERFSAAPSDSTHLENQTPVKIGGCFSVGA